MTDALFVDTKPISEADLLERLSHALIRISQTTPRVIASPPTQPRRASVAILIRVRPTLEDEEWLAEQYDAEGQPMPGTEAARLAEALTSPTSAEAMSRSASGAGVTSSGAVEMSSNDVSASVPGLGGSHVSVAHASEVPHGTLGESFTSSLLPDSVNELRPSAATVDPQAAQALEPSSSTGGVKQPGAVPMSAASSMQTHSRSRAVSIASAGSLGGGSQQIESTIPLEKFFRLPWVRRGAPEILYIKRASRAGDNWSSHVAFPGGRQEEGDENGLYTSMRETWEEVGIDLAEKEFACVGQLDDREITTSLGKRLLMVLSPFGKSVYSIPFDESAALTNDSLSVFVQVSPFSPHPDLQPTEVASAHWIPLSLLYTPSPNWGITSVDIANRLAPKSPAVRWILRTLVGKMDFKCILLPNEPVAEAFDSADGSPVEIGSLAGRHPALLDGEKPQLRLWGLTLGMTLDVLAHMSTFDSLALPKSQHRRSSQRLPYESGEDGIPSFSSLIQKPGPTSRLILQHLRDELHLSPPPHAAALAPSMTSVFPKFSYPDVNL